ncbi:MAG: NADAR domain-containing protein, partial [Blastocatellia bacterium]
MRAVVKVKQSQGRHSSNATRYIAGSKLDPEREGDKSRPLFTNKGHDDLTYRKADGFLTTGHGAPIKNDLIHFSISFHNEDFESLGSNDRRRVELLREAAREAMDEFRSDLRVSDWRWVAGVHLNTPHPHIHFLVFKEMTTDRGKPRRLGRIPKRLLPYKERSPDGAGAAVEGKLGEAFVAALDRAQQRAAPKREGLEREGLEREGQDMARTLLSNTLEFDRPLVHQGIEYRTVENFFQAMKTPKDDLDMRRKIAAASPEEARALGEQVKARPDWQEIHLQVLETALRHKFAPGTKWYTKLRATGDTDILDGSKDNHIGNLLMRVRDSREKVITSDEILLEANQCNPSIAGREFIQELILRGPAPEPVNPPEVPSNIREALKDRQVDDSYYNSQPEKADWLGERSQELRDLY